MEAAVPCPAIDTRRLKPLQQRINNTVITVSESGQVILNVKSRRNKLCSSHGEVTKELIRISPDGKQIEVVKVLEEVTSTDEDHTCSQPGQIYTYPHMPAKVWKKYHHTYKFLEVIKSVTAKVTMVTDRARCKLMENSPNPNFQVCFHDGVTLLFSNSKVTLTEPDGSSLTFHEDLASSHVSSDTLTLLEYSLQCRVQCLKIESSLNSLQMGRSHHTFFPVIIGMGSQPFLPSLHETKPETGDKITNHSYNIGQAILNQRLTLQSLDTVCTETDIHKRPAHSEPSQGQMQEIRNGFSCSMKDCPCQHDSLDMPRYQSLSDKNMPVPVQFSCVQNSPQGTQLQNISSKVEDHNLPLENSSSFDDFSSNFNLNYACDSSLTTPVIPNAIAANVQPGNSNFQEGKTETDDHQLQHWLDKPDNVATPHLMKTFQAGCTIDRNLCNSLALSENIGSKYMCTNEQLTIPKSHTCTGDNTVFQTNHLLCNLDKPFSYHTQFQHLFLTPQKSSAECESYLYPFSTQVIRYRQNKPARYESNTDESQLKNVKRNLFSSQTFEEVEPSSPRGASPENILIQGMNNFSDCTTNATLPYQNTELLARMPSLPPDDMSHQTRMFDALTTSAQCTPVKSPHITKSILGYSQFPGMLTEDQIEPPGTPLCLNTNSMQISTQSRQILSNFSDEGNSMENSDMINTNIAKQIGQLQTGELFPDTVSKKITPIRKVACLSPLKFRDGNMQRSAVMEHSGKITNAFSPMKYQISPVKSIKSSLGDCKSPEYSISNYQNSPSLENLVKPISDPDTFIKSAFSSHPAEPLCKDFPNFLPSANKWNGLDLPFSRHARHSLDVSSDGHSGSSRSSASDIICQVFVAYVGWASLYASGTVWILYNDGTQLGVKSTEAALIYVDQDGSQTRYNNSDVLPEIVKMKLEKLPKVIDLLMKSQSTDCPETHLWQS